MVNRQRKISREWHLVGFTVVQGLQTLLERKNLRGEKCEICWWVDIKHLQKCTIDDIRKISDELIDLQKNDTESFDIKPHQLSGSFRTKFGEDIKLKLSILTQLGKESVITLE